MSELIGPGDRVVFKDPYNDLPEKSGVMKQEWCEYGDHVYGIDFDDGTYAEVALEGVRLADEEYEYAVTWLYSLTGKHYGIAEYQWTTLDKALAQAVEAEEEDGREGVKLVKRRKAGKVEDV